MIALTLLGTVLAALVGMLAGLAIFGTGKDRP